MTETDSILRIQIPEANMEYWDNKKTEIRHFKFLHGDRPIYVKRFVELAKVLAEEPFPRREAQTESWEFPLEIGYMLVEDILKEVGFKGDLTKKIDELEWTAEYNLSPEEYIKKHPEEFEETKQMEKPKMNNEALDLTKAKDLTNKSDFDLQKEKEDLIKKGGYYTVEGGTKVADSRKLSETVNKLADKGIIVINTEIIDCDKTEEKAWARVRCINAKTGQYNEGYVVHLYKTCRESFLLDMIKKHAYGKGENPIQEFDKNGKMILTQKAIKALTIRTMNFKKFAERDAATKAQRIAQDKMLNREWRTQAEIDSEDFEVNMVNDSK